MRNRLATRCVAWVAVACLSLAAGGQPLADRVPADALIYVGWGGAEVMGPGYEGSHLKAVLAESEIPKLINQTLPAFLRKLGAREPEVGQVAGLASAIGGPMWRHPSAFYFGGLDMAGAGPGRPPTPKFAILCDAGAEGRAMADTLKGLIANAGAPYDIKVEEQNGSVAVFAGIAGYGAGQKPAAALPGAPAFRAAMAHVGKDAVAAVYVDHEAALKLVDTLVPAGSPPGQQWAKVRDAIGLGSIKRVAFTAGFDGKDWMTHGFVDSPAPRTGVVAQMMNTKPLDAEFFKVIPESATTAMAGRFDLGGLVDGLRAAVVQIEPQAGQQIDQMLAGLKQNIGVDPKADVIDALGDQWALYNDPMAVGSGMAGLVLVNRPKDAAKLEASVSKLEDLGNQIMRQNQGRNGPEVQIRRATARGTNLHYLSIPLVSPTWAVRDGFWYAGLYPQPVVAAAEQVAGHGRSIADNQAYQALRKRLGDQRATGVAFIDLPKTAPEAYGQTLLMSRLLLGAGDMFGADTPPLVLPTLNKLMPHLSVAGGVSWIDDAGWHTRSVEPFPGSTMLAGGGGEAAVAAPALMASILLPSLNKARETANRVKCGSNLRQIGQGCLLYANENKGKYPPDLGTLVATEDLTWQVFVCPSAGDKPGPPPGGDPKAMVQWVNQNADYVYVGQGLNSATAAADTVVCYEKPNDHGNQGINMLYGDGHVEWQMMAGAMQEIERSKQKRGAGGGGL